MRVIPDTSVNNETHRDQTAGNEDDKSKARGVEKNGDIASTENNCQEVLDECIDR